jgi:hypothetical protein
MAPAETPTVGVVLSILGIVALAMLLPVALLLVVPTTVLAFGAVGPQRLDGRAEVSWGAGAISFDASRHGAFVRLFGRPVHRVRHLPRRGPKAPKPESEDDTEPRKRRRVRARTVVRITRRGLRSLRFRARLAGRVGTGCPAQTARLFGVLAASRHLGPALDTRRLHVDWVEPALDMEGELTARIWPAGLAWIVATELIRSR